MPDRIDPSLYTHPRIMFAEQVVANGATFAWNQNEFKTSRPMIVDWVVFSEETFSLNIGAPGMTGLFGLNFNFDVNARNSYYPQPYVNSAMFGTFYDADRTSNPVAVSPANTIIMTQFYWRHPARWVYNVGQDVHIDWVNPIAAVPLPVALPWNVGMQGVGTLTGHRRLFNMQSNVLAGAAGAIVSNTTAAPQTMANPGSEPYLIEGWMWSPVGANWAAGDPRWLNHLRYKVVPTEGDAWSDVAVPLIFYGVHQGIANRSVWWRSTGGPLFLNAGDMMNFYVQNLSGGNTNVQVAVIGRVMPGYLGGV